MGRDEEAGEKFRRAIELAPEEPAGYFCHAQWLTRHGREEEAVGAFMKVLQLDPTYPGAHLKLGELYYRRRDLMPARKHLRAELLLRPQEIRVLMDLANLLLDTGQNRAAVACLKRLVQADAQSVSGWQNLAVAQFMVGRYSDGIASCHEALRLSPRNATAAFNLALAYQHQRRYDEALKWIRRGLELDPRDNSLQRLELRIRVFRWRSRSMRLLRALLGLRRRR
jgi:Flp pilus assembly protein TadD